MAKSKITVLVVEPEKEPYLRMIDNTLEAKQKIVGGYIENVVISLSGSNRYINIVVNEEGKLDNLPVNRIMSFTNSIGQTYLDYIHGTFFVSASVEEEYVGLNEREIVEMIEKFSYMTFDIGGKR